MNIMKHLYHICHAGKAFLLAFLATGILTACSDDDTILSALSTPNITNSNATVSTLTFEWDKVENVSQYVYEFRDPNGTLVSGDVTMKNRIVFTGLKASTTYTLDVWAYAEYGSTTHKASQVASLTGTTADIITLQMSEPTVTVDNNTATATITWPAVEHAASYKYSYILDDEEQSGSTTDPSLVLEHLSTGTYNVAISAIPDKNDEAYAASPAVNATFTIEFVKAEQWRKEGCYYAADNRNWPATIVSYNDGTYVIEGWFGVQGYNLEFSVNADGSINLLNAYSGSTYVNTGLSGDEKWAELYVESYNGYSYSSFTGDKSQGDLWFYNYLTDGYDEFIWNSSGTVSIDDLVGEWNEHSYGSCEYLWYDDAFDWNTNTVNITKVDDNTIKIANFFYSDDVLTATVDMDAKTISIAPGQTFLTYYTFATENDSNTPVIGYINDDATSISMSGWSLWWSGYTYVEDAVTTLTKQ